MRSKLAIKNAAKITGTPNSLIEFDTAAPIPEVRNTPPNIPPAPVINTTEQIAGKEDSISFSSEILSTPRAAPSVNIAISRVMSRAIGVLPIMRMVCTHS